MLRDWKDILYEQHIKNLEAMTRIFIDNIYVERYIELLEDEGFKYKLIEGDFRTAFEVDVEDDDEAKMAVILRDEATF